MANPKRVSLSLEGEGTVSEQARKTPTRRFTVSALTTLLLFAGVTVVLQSASAVTITMGGDDNFNAGSTVTITMTVTYDTTEFIPVIYNRLIFEGPSPPGPIAKDFRWIVDGSIRQNDGCSSLAVAISGGLGTTAGYGYAASGTFLGKSTGYGYGAGAGHGASGYGYTVGSNVFAGYGSGAGYGYNAVSGQGTIIYTITFNASCLSSTAASFRMTGEVTTDYFGFQSAFRTISIGGGGGGGGSSGGGTTTPGGTGTAAGQTQTVTATTITAPPGATAAFRATIATAAAGNNIQINTGDATFPTITLLTSDALTNVDVTITSWPATAPPPGTSAPPAGLTIGAYLEITMSGGDKAQSATITIKLPQSAVPNVAQGVLLHFVNAAWNPESKITFTLSGGVYTGTATTTCCSTFAVAFDVTSPTITLAGIPAGDASNTVTMTATAADNLMLTKVEWFVDGVSKSTDTTAPYEFAFDTKTVPNGAHTIRAVASDFVDNKAEASSPMQVNNVGGPSPSPTSPTVPPDVEGPGKGGISGIVWLIIALVIIGLIVGAIVLAGRKPKKP